MSLRQILGAGLSVVLLAVAAALPRTAKADERPGCTSVTRSNLVDCALIASLSVRSEGWAMRAAEGRLQAASPWLPSNPVLAVSVARREEGQRADKNWSAELSQELEVAGQRGMRRAVARAELEAAKQRRSLVMREVAAAAWQAYFEALAARESERVAMRLEAAMAVIAAALGQFSEQGLASGVDADLARVAALNAEQARRAAGRRRLLAEVRLATILGVPPEGGTTLNVTGELAPLPASTVERASAPGAARPELAILEAERRAFEARASSFQRARVPNVTVNVFAQRDGFAERVYGVGLALPLPLPYPVGRTYAGEIAEAEALAQQSRAEGEKTRRELRGNLASARAEYASYVEALQTFTPESLARAEQTLHDTAEQVATGRIAVRDAIFAERTLIEFLETNIEARRALCLASVALARAAGVALERGAP